MKTREEALAYGLSFPDTYQDAPFHDDNWQLVRVQGSKKAFLWTYERDGFMNLNVKADPEWRDFWRSTYKSVVAGWHQNKECWNTIILDGTIPDRDIKRMIEESYHIVTYSPSKKIYEAVKKIPKGRVATYGEFAFGGAGAQAKLLLEEGIEVVDGKVDLNKYGIEFMKTVYGLGYTLTNRQDSE